MVEVLENVKQQQAILEQAAKKLSHSNSGMDSDTARQLQYMLNTVLEQTNEIQNKLPKIAQEEGKRTDSMELPVLVPGKSKKYPNIAPLEPNTFTVCRGRGGTVNRIDRSNRGGATRRPVRERLNGYIENGSPPREVTENVDWQQYEDEASSPDRYDSNQRSYNSSGRQTNFNKCQNRYEQNRKQRSPNRGKQFRNYKDNQHFSNRNRQSPTRSNHSPSRGSYYSRSASRNLSTSPSRRVSRSRSPNHYRHRRTSRDDDTISVSPHRRRQYSPERKRRRFENRNSPNIFYEEDEYRDDEWRRSEERRNDR